MGLFVAFVDWVAIPIFHTKIPSRTVIGASVIAWLAIGTLVNARVTDDCRTQYGLNLYKTYRTGNGEPHQDEKND